MEQKHTFEFLAEKVYLPGYMLLRKEDYDRKGATFEFEVKEPPVARSSIVNYLTPRGLHICLSQGSYALVENMAREGMLEDYDVSSLRENLLSGRGRITELYQKFRKEVGLSKPIQGRFDIYKLRLGKMPILKLDFSFANNAISGNLVSVIAPKPVPQTNQDLIRFTNLLE
jgi:hypothetical protein